MKKLVDKGILSLINNINIENYLVDNFRIKNKENNTKITSIKNNILSVNRISFKPYFNEIKDENINFVKLSGLSDFIFFIKNFEYANICVENKHYLFYAFELEPIYPFNNNLSNNKIKKLKELKKLLINRFIYIRNQYKNIKQEINENDFHAKIEKFIPLECEYNKNKFIVVNCITNECTEIAEELKICIKNAYDFFDEDFSFESFYCESKEYSIYKNNFESYYNELLNDTEFVEDEDEFYDENYSIYLNSFPGKKYHLNYYLFNLNQKAAIKLLKNALLKIKIDTISEININYLKGNILVSQLFNSKMLIDEFISIETKNYFNIFVKMLLFTDSNELENIVEKINNSCEEKRKIKLIHEIKAVIDVKTNYDKTIIYNNCSTSKSENVYKIIVPLNSIIFTHSIIKIADIYNEIFSNLNVKIRDIDFSSKLFGNKTIKKKLKEISDSGQPLKIVSFENIICKKDKIKRDTLILSDEQNNKSRFLLEDLEFSVNNITKISELKGKNYIISPDAIRGNFVFENTKSNLKINTNLKNKYICVNDYVTFKNSCNILPKNFCKEKRYKVIEIFDKEYKTGLYSGKSKALLVNEQGNTTIVPMTMIKKKTNN